MSVESWDKNEIKKLAAASGKPLEVQCAEAFLKTEWDVRLVHPRSGAIPTRGIAWYRGYVDDLHTNSFSVRVRSRIQFHSIGNT